MSFCVATGSPLARLSPSNTRVRSWPQNDRRLCDLGSALHARRGRRLGASGAWLRASRLSAATCTPSTEGVRSASRSIPSTRREARGRACTFAPFSSTAARLCRLPEGTRRAPRGDRWRKPRVSWGTATLPDGTLAFGLHWAAGRLSWCDGTSPRFNPMKGGDRLRRGPRNLYCVSEGPPRPRKSRDGKSKCQR